MSDPKVASILDQISAGATTLGGVIPGPWGIAVAIAGAATGIAAGILRSGQTPATRAKDPDALLDAMAAHWRAQRPPPTQPSGPPN